MIKNNVTFEQAKWLKEKGFNIPCREGWYIAQLDPYKGQLFPDDTGGKHEIEKPEQHQVVEWLRINHGIWVWVRPYKDHAADNNDPIQHQMNVYKNGVTVSKEFNSHEEAYSASFDYIKDNNLI
jgi:hypothetical protein